MVRVESKAILDNLVSRYTSLGACRDDIERAFDLLARCFSTDHKLLIGGNGGSAADSEHVVGELMKGFMKKRAIGTAAREKLRKSCPDEAEYLGERLQGALPAISLTGSPALATAFSNDVDPAMSFAQQVFGLGRAGDALLAISTSGNSKNLIHAANVARAFGLSTVALTGEDGGRLAALANVAIRVPERATYRVQELHLPVYHALCAMLEVEFFPSSEKGLPLPPESP